MEARTAEFAELSTGKAEVARRSTVGSGTRASPTSSRRCSARRTPSRARTSTSPSRSRPASSGSSRRTSRRSSGSSRGSRRRSSAAIASSRSPRRRARWRRSSSPRCFATSDVPAGAVNLLTGQRAELAPWLASHMDVNAIDLTGADGLARRPRARRRRERQARRPRRARLAEPVRDLGLPRAEDRLAPDRRVDYALRTQVPGSRRLSQRISEGDGIAIIVRVSDADSARAAEEQGAKAIAVDHAIPGIRTRPRFRFSGWAKGPRSMRTR